MAAESATNELPYLTGDLPGTGGVIKAQPADFVVEELALYEPAGEGEHLYLTLRREGWTTRDLARRLATCLGTSERDVGYAGLKDKVARVTQRFSLAVRGDPAELARRVAGELGVEVLDARRHANKLRRGHLLGNRFTLVLREVPAERLAHAAALVQRLEARGLANFYGVQRLGARGEHARRGARDLAAPRPTFASRFALNAFQAELFNRWLVARLERGWFERLLTGDVAKKVANGALFDVLDEAAENERAARREIVATGPIYGGALRPAAGEPGRLEAELLAEAGCTLEDFARARLDGTRRAARVFPGELACEAGEGTLTLRFTLGKGVYATTLVREFQRGEAQLAEIDEE